MAEEILFKITIDDSDNSKLAGIQSEIEKTKAAFDELNKKIKAGQQLTEAEAKSYAALNARLIELNKQKKDYTRTLENEINKTRANENSLAAMRAQVAKLRQEYEKLDPASQASKKLAAEIANLQTKINNADFATKNFRGNVGNYKNSILEALQSTNLFNGGLSQLTSGLGGAGNMVTGMISKLGPYGMAIGAATTAVMGLVKAYISNEEGAKAFERAKTIVTGALDDIKDKFSEVANVAFGDPTQPGESFFEKLARGFARFTGYLSGGIQSMITANVKATVRQVLETQLQEATKALKDAEVELAKRKAKIAELRFKAEDTRDIKERERLLREASQLEQDSYAKVLAAMKKEYEAKNALLSLNKNSAEQNDELRQMQIKIANAELEQDNRKRELAGALKSAEKEYTAVVQAESEKRRQARLQEEREARLQEEREMNKIDRVQSIPVESAYKSLSGQFQAMMDANRKATAQLQPMYKDDFEAKTKYLRMEEKALYDSLKARRITEFEYYSSLGELYQKDKEIFQAEQQAKLEIVTGAMGSFAGLFRQESVAHKALSIAQATIDTYAAATRALKLGWPFGWIQAAAIMAQGFSNVKKIMAVKLQEGGVLRGPSHKEGGIPILIKATGGIVEAEGGELIVNKNIWKRPDYVRAISEMNAATGGRRFFADGGVLPASGQVSDLKEVIKDTVRSVVNIPVVVSLNDINSATRKAHVINSLSVLT